MKKTLIFFTLIFLLNCSVNKKNALTPVIKMIKNDIPITKILHILCDDSNALSSQYTRINLLLLEGNFINVEEIIEKKYNENRIYLSYYVDDEIYLFKSENLKKLKSDSVFINNIIKYWNDKVDTDFFKIVEKLKNNKKRKININNFLIKNCPDYLSYYIDLIIYLSIRLKKENDFKEIIKKYSLSEKKIVIKKLKLIQKVLKKPVKKHLYTYIELSDYFFKLKLINLSNKILNNIIIKRKEFNEYIIIRKIRNLIYEKKYNEAIRLIRENKNKYPENKTFKYYEKYINMHRERG